MRTSSHDMFVFKSRNSSVKLYRKDTQGIFNKIVYTTHALEIKNVRQKYLSLTNGLSVPSALSPTISS